MSFKGESMLKKKALMLYNPGETKFNLTFPPELLAELQEKVDLVIPPRPLPALESYKELYEADILITGWGTPHLPLDVMDKGRVQYICHVTGAMRGMLDRNFFEHGIPVTNWGSSISRTIAEASLTMILGSLRRIRIIQEEIHNRGGYRGVPFPDSLFERKVGLFGLGAIARELVKLLQPFHTHISAYDPYVPEEVFTQLSVERVTDLRTLFSTSDIISVHAAKTEETYHIINKELLQLMPPDGVLVNTSRGSLISEDDLAAELNAGRLWAALDVYEREPLSQDSPLRGSERILLFPHQAGPTLDRYIDMGRLVLDNIQRFLDDEPLLYQVSLKQYDIMT
jgi:phosphoglycerate dehydrogenase-like enzyme